MKEKNWGQIIEEGHHYGPPPHGKDDERML